jgi:TRAP transporter TAXI family solute receptor
METKQYQQLAIGVALLSVIAAIATGRLPRWLRAVLVVGLAVLAGGAGLFAYRQFATPTTLTVAAGSLDGDVPRFMAALASKIASSDSGVRLKVLDKGTASEAAKAFAAGDADLAVVRADADDLSSAQTVVVFTRAVVLIVVPPGSSIAGMDDLKGKTVGLVGGELNRRVVDALNKEYDLERAKVQFKNLAVGDVAQALKTKQVSALLVVMPISDKYLGMLRDLFPRNGKSNPTLLAIESAGAIAAVTKYYESYDLPKGTLQGNPPIPDDDLTTLRVPFYLVAKNTLSEDVVAALTKAIMETRRDLIAEYPVLKQISEPNTDKDDDKDTFIPMHPGATAYFEGTQKTFLDKYGDQFMYASMVFGSLASIFAAAWKYMTKNNDEGPESLPLMRLYALKDQLREAQSESDLAQTEKRIDELFKAELEKHARRDAEAADPGALGLAMQQLSNAMAQQRAILAGGGRIASKSLEAEKAH